MKCWRTATIFYLKNYCQLNSVPARLIAAIILFFAVSALAQTTNVLSDAEIQGRALAQKILAQQPNEDKITFGTLSVRSKSIDQKLILAMMVSKLKDSSWLNTYSAESSNKVEAVTILHCSNEANSYLLGPTNFGGSTKPFSQVNRINVEDAFAKTLGCSDFSFADLGLEFFHWPQQKVLKKEIHRSCACTVLESTNPNPSTNGYSRVVSWVDTESLGIVEAYAYDANGKKLKNFYPKDIKKVNGQWQVQTLVMENLQTGSKSRLEFDLKK